MKRQLEDITPADALARAQDHTISAVRAIAALPDRTEDPTGHAEAIVAWHAHLKAADGYLESVRRDVSGMLTGGDGDAAEEAEALADPEVRAMRESTRAAAATVLLASGNIAGAQKLIRRTPAKPRRPR